MLRFEKWRGHGSSAADIRHGNVKLLVLNSGGK